MTGGSAGIGLAIALALADEGYDVTICGRDSDKLANAAEAATELAGRLVPVAVNLADDEAVATLTGAHLERCGGVDVLVNNAGLGLVGPITDVTTRKLDLELDVNFRSAFRLLQGCIPALREAGGRHGKALVVNVSSLVARLYPPNASVYAATKAALVSLSHSAHAELSEAGVQVTALLPGLVDTPGTAWVDETTRPTMFLPQDVAEAVRFLLRTSPRCFVPEITMIGAGPGVLHSPIEWTEATT